MPKSYPYLPKIKPDLNEFEIDFFEERASILEFEAGIDRRVAEYLSLEEILKIRDVDKVSGTSNIPDDILKLLNESKTVKLFNQAQDFIDGHLYYGVRFGDESLIISSSKEIFKLSDSIKRGLTPKSPFVRKSNFTADGIKLYFDGEKINPSSLFYEIKTYIKRYIHLQNDSYYDLFALYAMATYVFRIFRYFPYIHLYAEKGSGKSTLMSVLSRICFNGTFISNSTPATIFRLVEDLSPTLFIDEAEELYKSYSEANKILIGVLNDGFGRDSAIPRTESTGESYGIRFFSAYSPKVLASISEFDNVLRDRMIRVKMLRKKSDEKVDRYIATASVMDEQNSLRIKMYILGLQFAWSIFQKYSQFNYNAQQHLHLSNRNADLWTPVLIMANLVDEYSETSLPRISDSIIQLSKEMVTDKSSDNSIDDINLRILIAVKRYITDNNPFKQEGTFDFYTTEDIYKYVNRVEDFDKYFSKTKFSQILRKFGIENKVIKIDGNPVRAYLINPLKLSEIIERYE